MAVILPPRVKGSRKRTLTITWLDTNGEIVDLSGATITGDLQNLTAGTAATAITGTLALVTAASGIFSWAMSAADVGTLGAYKVQFKATYSDTLCEKTLVANWEVVESLT